LFVENDLTPNPSPDRRGERNKEALSWVKVSPLRGDLEGSSRLNVENDFIPALFPERE
jgi:hypothetical protein